MREPQIGSTMRRFIEFLEADIKRWEEAASFCEQHVASFKDELAERSGKEKAKVYRDRAQEYRNLLEQLRKEDGKP